MIEGPLGEIRNVVRMNMDAKPQAQIPPSEPKPGYKSSEGQAAGALVMLVLWLIGSGKVNLNDLHTQVVVFGFLALVWGLYFLGRVLLKSKHAELGAEILDYDAQAAATIEALERRLGGLPVPLPPKDGGAQ